MTGHRLVTITDAAHATSIPPATIRKWVSTGRLTTHGPRPARVDLADLATILDTYHPRPTRHRT